jgi:hypothetical protein
MIHNITHESEDEKLIKNKTEVFELMWYSEFEPNLLKNFLGFQVIRRFIKIFTENSQKSRSE